MQNTPTYTRNVSNMRLAFAREDISKLVLPLTDKMANEIVKNSHGKIDIVQDLTLVIPTAIVQQYLGISAKDKDLIKWSSFMFHYLFLDLSADKKLEPKVLQAATDSRNFIDNLIIERKKDLNQKDDVLNRCLVMQKADLPGMDDEIIRNNLLGLLIGCIPTLSMATSFAR